MNKARLEKEFTPFTIDLKAAKETESSKDTTLEPVQEDRHETHQTSKTKKKEELSVAEQLQRGMICENDVRKMVE